MDVATLARRFGVTEKFIRARASRGLLPARRWGGRLIFLEDEINRFLEALPGVGVEEALANVRVRRGVCR